MDGAAEQVSEIGTRYVDDTAIIVAMGERLAQASMKRSATR